MGFEVGYVLFFFFWFGLADRFGVIYDGSGCKCILENRGMGYDKGVERRGVNFVWGYNAERIFFK